jgi:hypothetical protein
MYGNIQYIEKIWYGYYYVSNACVETGMSTLSLAGWLASLAEWRTIAAAPSTMAAACVIAMLRGKPMSTPPSASASITCRAQSTLSEMKNTRNII